jgi:hypothetical protein
VRGLVLAGKFVLCLAGAQEHRIAAAWLMKWTLFLILSLQSKTTHAQEGPRNLVRSSAALLTRLLCRTVRGSEWMPKQQQHMRRTSRAMHGSLALMARPPVAFSGHRHPAFSALNARTMVGSGNRSMSSYDVEHSAMQDLLKTGPNPTSSNLPTNTLVFVLATAQQASEERRASLLAMGMSLTRAALIARCD